MLLEHIKYNLTLYAPEPLLKVTIFSKSLSNKKIRYPQNSRDLDFGQVV